MLKRRHDSVSAARGRDQARSFVGGLRHGNTGLGACPWPLARLTLDESTLTVGPSVRSLRGVVATWSTPLEDVTEVHAIGKVVPWAFIRFQTRSGDWILFGSFDRAGILEQLVRAGLPVTAKQGRFHFFDPNHE